MVVCRRTTAGRTGLTTGSDAGSDGDWLEVVDSGWSKTVSVVVVVSFNSLLADLAAWASAVVALVKGLAIGLLARRDRRFLLADDDEVDASEVEPHDEEEEADWAGSSEVVSTSGGCQHTVAAEFSPIL